MKRKPSAFKTIVFVLRGLSAFGLLAWAVLSPFHYFDVTSKGHTQASGEYIYPFKAKGEGYFYMTQSQKTFGDSILVLVISSGLLSIITWSAPGMRKF
ncbi:hypothetical protein [Asticcacaulis sp.]|uniref:hypothetical protein n=1 Tax=Asticcacaulis sp. TaxID=1872648 RepID=UPI002D7F028E|nr:hypothetical protein [Asticcacaulis sp.]